MAVIQKIRNRAGLIITIIGASMVLFILSDALSNNSSLLFSQSNTVAEVYGEEISIQDFQKYLNDQIESYKINTGKRDLSNEDTELLREQSFNQLIFEIILNKQIANLGISVSSNELFDLVQGSSPHPLIRQAFTDPNTGVFEPTRVMQFLKSLDYDQTGEARSKWKVLEDDIYKTQLRHKYNTLIKKGIYITSLEAKNINTERAKQAAIELIALKFDEVNDTEIQITEDDIKNYYEQHKNDYEQEASRNIEFVNFDIVASKDDSTEILSWCQNILKEFSETIDDSVFVNINSDLPFINTYFKKGELSKEIDSLMFAVDTGTVYGPYIESGAYRVTKLRNRKFIPDSVKARHILLKPSQQRNYKATLALTDSIKKLIDDGKDFAALAKTFSDDPGSKEKGGELDWFEQGAMVKPFNDMCFYHSKKGQITITRSNFGFHIIELLDTKGANECVQVAVLVRDIVPSSTTERKLFALANEFAGNNQTVSDFNNTIAKSGLNKRIAENVKVNDRSIIGIPNARAIVQWANKASLGEISKILELDDKFVIAHLSKITDKGPAKLEDIRVQVELEIKKEKKGNLLSERIKKAMEGSQQIDQVAEKLGSATIASMDKISFFDAYIPNIGRELKLAGAIYVSESGRVIGPVVGELGVYVFSIELFQEVPELGDYSFIKNQVLTQNLANSDFNVYEALKETGNVVDNRADFY